MRLDTHLVELIYDIPLGKSTWSEVVEELRKEMNAALVCLFVAQPEQMPMLISATSNNDVVWQQYEQYYFQIDPWNAILASPAYQKNTIRSGRAFVSQKELKKTEYYNDFWKKFSLGETIGGILTTDSGITVQIGIPKYNDSKNYKTQEAQLLQYYCAHICRAIELDGFIGNSLPHGIYESGLIAKFGLTQAEAKLVLTLFKVNSLQEAANSLHRSYHTARTQLKSIFKKTEANNQIELLKRLISK